MLLGSVIAARIARRTALGAILRSTTRRHLVPMCSANFEKVQRNVSRRTMSTAADPKEGDWSKEDLKVDPKEQEQETHPLDAEKWTMVYKFKHINILRLFVRLKMYQSAMCLFSTAALPLLRFVGVEFAEETGMFVVATNLYLLLATLAIGHYAQQVAGILYINEAKDKVRLATLSFFGHRVDTMFDLNDIMHFSDLHGSGNSLFIKMQRYSKPKEEVYVYVTGGVLDRERFEDIFGTVPQLTPPRVTKYGKKKDT